ncbi:uncharacterized protein LOC143913728 isoform X2 [Arctopsyche grandis]
MNGTKSSVESSAFIQKMTLVTFSNILAKKGLFPDDVFLEYKFDNLVVKTLKSDSPLEKASNVYNWIVATFEAIDKKYLQRIDLCFYEDEENLESLIESYTCKFKYDNQEIEMTTRNRNSDRLSLSMDLTQKSALNILRYISKLGGKNELPERFDFGFRLFYYNDVTPKGYEPKGFYPCLRDDFTHPPVIDQLMCGKLFTPYHKLKVYEYIKKSDNLVEMTNEETQNFEMDFSANMEIPKLSQGENSLFDPISPENVSAGNLAQSENDDLIQCPCGTTLKIFKLIRCTSCKYWQHAPCFGVLDEHINYIAKHMCDKCGSDNLLFTDESLLKMPSRNKGAIMCLFRCMLMHFLNYTEIDFKQISEELLPLKYVAHRVLKLLKANLVVKEISSVKTKGSPQLYAINTDHLKHVVIPKHFKPRPSTPLFNSPNSPPGALNLPEDYNMETEMNIPSEVCYTNDDPYAMSEENIFKSPTAPIRKNNKRKRSTVEYMQAELPIKKRATRFNN